MIETLIAGQRANLFNFFSIYAPQNLLKQPKSLNLQVFSTLKIHPSYIFANFIHRINVKTFFGKRLNFFKSEATLLVIATHTLATIGHS